MAFPLVVMSVISCAQNNYSFNEMIIYGIDFESNTRFSYSPEYLINRVDSMSVDGVNVLNMYRCDLTPSQVFLTSKRINKIGLKLDKNIVDIDSKMVVVMIDVNGNKNLLSFDSALMATYNGYVVINAKELYKTFNPYRKKCVRPR